jgi:hypothetical protein
MKKLSRG